MQIDRVFIIAFGGIEKRELRFSSGFQVVTKENEWGKTTVMRFIYMMLYGRVERSLREQIRPKSGAVPAGEMDITVGGIAYRIQKTFMRSERTDQVRITRLDTGEAVTLAPMEEVGQRLLGMDRQSFLRCMFIPEADVSESLGSGAALSSRLQNLAQSGTEDTDFDKTLARLDKGIRHAERKIKALSEQYSLLCVEGARLAEAQAQYKAISDQKVQQKYAIDALYARYTELLAAAEADSARQKLKKAQAAAAQKIELEETKNALSGNIPREHMGDFIADCRRLYAAYASIVVPEACLQAEEEAFAVLKQKKEHAQSVPVPEKPKLSPLFYAVCGMAVLCIGLGFRVAFLWGIALVCAIASYIIYIKYRRAALQAQMQAKRIQNNISDCKAQMTAFLSAHGVDSEELWHAAKENRRLLTEKKAQAKAAFLHKISAFSPCRQIEEAEELLLWLEDTHAQVLRLEAMPMDAFCPTDQELALWEETAKKASSPADWEALRRTEDALNQKQEQYAALCRMKAPDAAALTENQQQKDKIQQKIAACTEHKQVLCLAKQAYTDAMAQMTKELRPQVNRLASDYMHRLTQGAYHEIAVDSAQPAARREGWEFLPHELSRGTHAQLYLAMRLAYGALLAREEPVFLFLDDALHAFDAQRQRQAMALLSEEAEKSFSQILLFTCRDR